MSKSQARGHPKANEKLLSPNRRKPIAQGNFQIALQNLAKGESLTASAREAKVSAERLRNQLRDQKLISKNSQRWVLRKRVPRHWIIPSEGKLVKVTTSSKRTNSVLGKYNANLNKYLRSQDDALLEPFKGMIIVDDSGIAHLLETDPNTLYKLRHASNDGFENIYNIATTL